MGRHDVIKRAAAAVFFLACIALIVGVIFVLGIEKGFTEAKFQMTALFKKVGGLAIGAPVRVSGVTVGTVADIDFLKDDIEGRTVKVDLSLYTKYKSQLLKSTKVAIITEGVLGEKIVEITTRPGFHRGDLSKPIIGQDPLDVQNLAETFGDAARSLSEASRSIHAMMDELEILATSFNRVLNRIEQRIIDGNLFKVF